MRNALLALLLLALGTTLRGEALVLVARVVGEDGAPIAADALELVAFLEPAEASSRRADRVRGTIGAGGEARVVAAEPGPNLVHLDLRSADATFLVPDGIVTPERVLVADREDEQAISIRIDRELLQRTLDAVQRAR